jgi:hypothetical protein
VDAKILQPGVRYHSANRLNGFDLPVYTTQKTAVATSTAIHRSDNERELKALIERMAGGDEHALARLYDITTGSFTAWLCEF